MGFLVQANSKATASSVIRRACITCAATAGLWGLCVLFRPNPAWQPSWMFFACWLVCAALVGAVWEWQVPDDEDVPPPSDDAGGQPVAGADRGGGIIH
jgi:hypothetical protein